MNKITKNLYSSLPALIFIHLSKIIFLLKDKPCPVSSPVQVKEKAGIFIKNIFGYILPLVLF